jgi:hypothetical protein
VVARVLDGPGLAVYDGHHDVVRRVGEADEPAPLEFRSGHPPDEAHVPQRPTPMAA